VSYLKIKNRAASTLASDVTDVATSWVLAADGGAKFPATGDFHVTCEDEIVKVTARNTDTLTVVRAQEGTIGAAHTAGKAVELRITAGVLESRTTWTADKLLKGAGAGADPTEIDVPTSAYTQGARVWRSTVQNIPTSTWTALSFDTELWDTDNCFDIGSPTRLTCKTAGKYLVIVQVSFEAETGVSGGSAIRKNGTTYYASGNYSSLATGFGMPVAAIFDLAVNDYIEAMVYQNRGSNLETVADAYDGPGFMMQRIG
jgi:hypothetical protein